MVNKVLKATAAETASAISRVAKEPASTYPYRVLGFEDTYTPSHKEIRQAASAINAKLRDGKDTVAETYKDAHTIIVNACKTIILALADNILKHKANANYYGVLGVESTASEQACNRAKNKLCSGLMHTDCILQLGITLNDAENKSFEDAVKAVTDACDKIKNPDATDTNNSATHNGNVTKAASCAADAKYNVDQATEARSAVYLAAGISDISAVATTGTQAVQACQENKKKIPKNRDEFGYDDRNQWDYDGLNFKKICKTFDDEAESQASKLKREIEYGALDASWFKSRRQRAYDEYIASSTYTNALEKYNREADLYWKARDAYYALFHSPIENIYSKKDIHSKIKKLEDGLDKNPASCFAYANNAETFADIVKLWAEAAQSIQSLVQQHIKLHGRDHVLDADIKNAAVLVNYCVQEATAYANAATAAHQKTVEYAEIEVKTHYDTEPFLEVAREVFKQRTKVATRHAHQNFMVTDQKPTPTTARPYHYYAVRATATSSVVLYYANANRQVEEVKLTSTSGIEALINNGASNMPLNLNQGYTLSPMRFRQYITAYGGHVPPSYKPRDAENFVDYMASTVEEDMRKAVPTEAYNADGTYKDPANRLSISQWLILRFALASKDNLDHFGDIELFTPEHRLTLQETDDISSWIHGSLKVDPLTPEYSLTHWQAFRQKFNWQLSLNLGTLCWTTTETNIRALFPREGTPNPNLPVLDRFKILRARVAYVHAIIMNDALDIFKRIHDIWSQYENNKKLFSDTFLEQEYMGNGFYYRILDKVAYVIQNHLNKHLAVTFNNDNKDFDAHNLTLAKNRHQATAFKTALCDDIANINFTSLQSPNSESLSSKMQAETLKLKDAIQKTAKSRTTKLLPSTNGDNRIDNANEILSNSSGSETGSNRGHSDSASDTRSNPGSGSSSPKPPRTAQTTVTAAEKGAMNSNANDGGEHSTDTSASVIDTSSVSFNGGYDSDSNTSLTPRSISPSPGITILTGPATTLPAGAATASLTNVISPPTSSASRLPSAVDNIFTYLKFTEQEKAHAKIFMEESHKILAVSNDLIKAFANSSQPQTVDSYLKFELEKLTLIKKTILCDAFMANACLKWNVNIMDQAGYVLVGNHNDNRTTLFGGINTILENENIASLSLDEMQVLDDFNNKYHLYSHPLIDTGEMCPDFWDKLIKPICEHIKNEREYISKKKQYEHAKKAKDLNLPFENNIFDTPAYAWVGQSKDATPTAPQTRTVTKRELETAELRLMSQRDALFEGLNEIHTITTQSYGKNRQLLHDGINVALKNADPSSSLTEEEKLFLDFLSQDGGVPLYSGPLFKHKGMVDTLDIFNLTCGRLIAIIREYRSKENKTATDYAQLINDLQAIANLPNDPMLQISYHGIFIHAQRKIDKIEHSQTVSSATAEPSLSQVVRDTNQTVTQPYYTTLMNASTVTGQSAEAAANENKTLTLQKAKVTFRDDLAKQEPKFIKADKHCDKGGAFWKGLFAAVFTAMTGFIGLASSAVRNALCFRTNTAAQMSTGFEKIKKATVAPSA